MITINNIKFPLEILKCKICNNELCCIHKLI